MGGFLDIFYSFGIGFQTELEEIICSILHNEPKCVPKVILITTLVLGMLWYFCLNSTQLCKYGIFM